jgi:hypothetical protein
VWEEGEGEENNNKKEVEEEEEKDYNDNSCLDCLDDENESLGSKK